ncbi:MAG: hypothetical protein U1U88_002336 [Lawsonella clevelandensis]
MTRKEARAREDARYTGMTKEEKKAAKARETEERRHAAGISPSADGCR